MTSDLLSDGWQRFEKDPVLLDWLESAELAARVTLTDPEHAQWHRCGGTWFAGVSVLPNDETGVVGDGPPLTGQAISTALQYVGQYVGKPVAWDRAQVSVCYPGYPKLREGEPKTSFRYRQKRDAAHVDGLLPVGLDRRRYLREHHQFVLGIPVGIADENASPLIVWEGSHEIMRKVFADFYAAAPPETWRDLDVTEVYHGARRRVFDTCKRVFVIAGRGEAYLVHRLALHGIAPWGDAANVRERMVIYFRPDSGDPAAWLWAP